MSRIRVVLTMGGLLLALLLGVAAGVMGVRMVAAGGSPIVTPAAVVKEIQTLSQLVTIQYVIEKVVVEQDVKWYGENRVLLVAHGVVKAGVDFRHLEEDDVEVSGTTIRIDLPPAHILDAYLDESKTQMIEHSTGMLRLFDEDLETVARQHAVLDIRKAAKDEGILNEAVERAQTQITALLLRLGYEKVEFAGP